MEKAIFINNIGQLKRVTNVFTRLYYGQEFCERLIPGTKDLRQVLSFVKKKNIEISLVTPYVTNFGLKRIRVLLETLSKGKIRCEVIVNDWGILNLLNREYPQFLPVLGRLLTKQKRGPQLIRLLNRSIKPRFFKNQQNPKIKSFILAKKLPQDLDFYYKGSNVSSVPVIHDFLNSRRIGRIELDNTGQGLFLELKDKLRASIYLPYVYISTTFYCLSAGCDQKEGPPLKRKPCKRQCQRYVFKLRHQSMHKVIYLKGNTQFYKNNYYRIKHWQGLGIDRIVYEPQIPV